MIVTIVSKLVYFTYSGDLSPTNIGVIIQLLGTMDIPADSYNHRFAGANCYCHVGVDLFSGDAAQMFL